MLIYKITNTVNGKVYIGQTKKTLEQRIKGHRNTFVSGRASYHLYLSMRKYGWEQFQFEVIDESAKNSEELDRLESYYIQKYDSMNSDKGYNMHLGGVSNPMDSQIVQNKHSTKMRSVEVRNKISKTMKKLRNEQGFPQEHLDNISKSLREGHANGTIVSPQKGKPLSQKQKDALLKALKTKVWCVDEQGNKIKEFDSVYDGAHWWKENGYYTANPKSLCTCIKSSYVEDRYIKGLKWYYEKRV